VLDLDHFKEINDANGHAAGDAVLAEFARRLRAEIREVDFAFRQGGEEFVVLLPETTTPESRNFAERLLRRVATHEFGEEGNRVRVTISIGMASYPDERVSDGLSLLELADTHLYRAKTDGRNRFRD
jgi:diguanylate cyclase (GGDEF)-like protein